MPGSSQVLAYGFQVANLQMMQMTRPNAKEFLEVYKGVVPEYGQLVEEFTSGPSIALEVRAENAVQEFRALTGPSDPEIGRYLRPQTLRAKFGVSKVQNGLHCTDLPEDGQLETEYFFKVLRG